MYKLCCSCISGWLLLVSPFCLGGTIFFKDGSQLSNVKILSIHQGRVTIEKDNAKKTFAFGKIKSYYQTNLKQGDGGAFLVDCADYSLSIYGVDMPKDGLDKDGKIEECKVKYRISRKGGKGDRAPFPYFYLYVLIRGDEQTGVRHIYRYYYPKGAKIRTKGYDRAAVLGVLARLDRDMIHFNFLSSSRRGVKMGLKSATFKLKKIKKREIIAYHLEIWGNKKIIGQRNWKEVGVRVGNNWWERY